MWRVFTRFYELTQEGLKGPDLQTLTFLRYFREKCPMKELHLFLRKLKLYTSSFWVILGQNFGKFNEQGEGGE